MYSYILFEQVSEFGTTADRLTWACSLATPRWHDALLKGGNMDFFSATNWRANLVSTPSLLCSGLWIRSTGEKKIKEHILSQVNLVDAFLSTTPPVPPRPRAGLGRCAS